MGAEFTIVLDTDDPQGLRDALEIATLLNRNHQTFGGKVKAKIGKIDLSSWFAMLPSWLKQERWILPFVSPSFVDGRWDNWIYRK